MIINKIGLELHFQLKTKTKLFSSARNQFSFKANTLTNSYDWGYPGTLPQLNQKAVELSLDAAYLLNCKINDWLYFDRKNYYYSDLPKGYQITQFYEPLGLRGYLWIFLPNQDWKKINITSISIEEDSAKSIYEKGNIFVDYNRSGIPLIEVVTEPDFNNYKQVEKFIKKIIRLFKKTKISNADFSKGSLRVDLNISTSIDGKNFCFRTEIKNLNSLQNIKKAIDQESHYQWKNISKIKKSSTKNYNEKLKKLVMLRFKFNKYDYCFIPENNIAPILIESHFKKERFFKLNNLKNWEDKFIKEHKLDFVSAEWLLNKSYLIPYFVKLKSYIFLREVVIPYLKTSKKTLENFNFNLAEKLLFAFSQKKINFTTLKNIFFKYEDGKNQLNLEKLILKKQENIILPEEIKMFYQTLDTFCKNDKNLKNNFDKNSQKTTNYLIGKIVQLKKHKISPKTLTDLIKKYFDRHRKK